MAAGFVVGASFGLVAYGILGDLEASLAWGTAIGALVAGTDPRLFLGLAAFFLLLPPVALVLGSDVLAEDLARTAFGVLALAVALEFRQGLGRGDRTDGDRQGVEGSA